MAVANPDPNDGDLGTSPIAYPAYSTGIQGTVFTQRIKDDVLKACGLEPNCDAVVDSAATVPYVKGIDAIVDLYTRNVFAHETFHMLGRVVPPDRKLENHYPQLGYVMDHHMYDKSYRKSGLVRWFISNKWSAADIPRFK